MRKVNVLLGSADRRLNASVETRVLDACYNVAAVETTKVSLLGQFVRHGCLASFDLLILAPDSLLPEPTKLCPIWDKVSSDQAAPAVTLTESLAAVCALKAQSAAPLMVLAAAPTIHNRFVNAGADSVLSEFFQPELLKSEVCRLLRLAPTGDEVEPSAWSLASLLLRGYQRLKRA